MSTVKINTSIPGPKSIELMNRRKENVARGPFHVTPVFVNKAHHAVIEDLDGNQFIDFASGIGVANTGHTPKEVVDAIQKQASDFIHTGFNVVPYASYIELCEKLNQLTPGKFKKKTFLANSGAEAVENAIKIARAHTKRSAVVCFDHAFHGRTFFAMSMTSKYKPYKYGFGALPGEVYRAPFPYLYRSDCKNEDAVSDQCFKQFLELANSRLQPDQIAAVIIEPVLGEGGFVVAPPRFLKQVSEFCTKNGIVFIADEIQSGFGRTGTLFATKQLMEDHGVTPDLITMAKGLGGGMPISAVTGRAEIMDAPIEGGIGGTFGGNPLSCVAALAVIGLMEEETLSHSKKIGMIIQQAFSGWAVSHPYIGDARGLGPMQALEFVKNKETKEPNPEYAKAVVQNALQKGLIVMSAGTYGNVIRLLVPLSIEESVLAEGLSLLQMSLKELK